MPIAPSTDSASDYEDIKEELLVYKLEEVKSDWIQDFGEIPKKLLEEINGKITDPNQERIPLLEDVVRKLRRELIEKNIEALNRKIRSWDSKVDFSNEIIDLKKIEQKLNNALAIDDLTECYNEDIYPIRIKVISKITVEKNKVIKEKNNLIQSYLVQIVIAIVFFIFGIMVTKLS